MSVSSPPYLNQLRADLACAFRWTARLNWHEGVANHFSVAADADGAKFLMNPAGRHFSRIRASDLLLLDSTATPTDDIDPTAWCLHGYLHRHVPAARCLLHTRALCHGFGVFGRLAHAHV